MFAILKKMIKPAKLSKCAEQEELFVIKESNISNVRNCAGGELGGYEPVEPSGSMS